MSNICKTCDPAEHSASEAMQRVELADELAPVVAALWYEMYVLPTAFVLQYIFHRKTSRGGLPIPFVSIHDNYIVDRYFSLVRACSG